MTLATAAVRPMSPVVPATPLAQMHVENLVLAVSSALTACSALQHVLMELDAALVQGAIALNGWLPSAVSQLEQEQLQEAGSAVHVAKVLAAHLAALQAEGSDISWCVSQLMCAQAEFSKEVQQWSHAVLPDVIFASPEQAVKDILTASPDGSLRKLCEHHSDAALRGGADPSTPLPLLPPPKHGLERLLQVEEQRPLSPLVQEHQAVQATAGFPHDATLFLRKLQVSRSPIRLESPAQKTSFRTQESNTTVALPRMVQRPGSKMGQLQALAMKRRLVQSDSDPAQLQTLQLVPQLNTGGAWERPALQESLELAVEARRVEEQAQTGDHESHDRGRFWEARFNETVKELHLAKQELVDVKGELTILRARKSRQGAAAVGVGAGAGAGAMCASKDGKRARKKSPPRKAGSSPTHGESKESGTEGMSESTAFPSNMTPRTGSSQNYSSSMLDDSGNSLGPSPLVFARLDTQTEESMADTDMESSLLSPFKGSARSAAEKASPKMVLADGSIDFVRKAKDKILRMQHEHQQLVARMKEKYTRDTQKLRDQLWETQQALSKLQHEHEELSKYCDEQGGKLMVTRSHYQKIESELEVEKMQRESVEAELENLKELSANNLKLHEEISAVLQHASATGKPIEGLLEKIVVRHYGIADDGGMSLARKRACHYWTLAAEYARKLMRVSVGKLDPRSREVAVGLAELCQRFESDFRDHPMGIHEFVSHYALIEETNSTMRDLITKCRQDTQIQATLVGHFDEMLAKMTATYDEAFHFAGGKAVATGFFDESHRVLRNFRRVRKGQRARQDVGFEILGLDALYALTKKANAKLHREVSALAIRTGGEAVLVTMKGRERARYKILTKYGNDTSCLTDMMRASLVYKSINDLYSAMFSIVARDLESDRHDFFLVEVQDRFRNPMDGYRDIVMLFNVDGTIGEVQMHIDLMLKAKQDDGHKIYEVQRQVNESLFGACVQNTLTNIFELVEEYKVCAANVRDKNGRNAMHYCCQLGSDKAVHVLLSHGADPWAADNSGVMPCELALRNEHFQVLILILVHMKEHEPHWKQPTLESLNTRNSLPTLDFSISAAEAAAMQSQPGKKALDPRLLRVAKKVVPWWCDHSTFEADIMERATKGRWLEVGRLFLALLQKYDVLQPVQDWMCDLASRGECQRLRTLIDAGFDRPPIPGVPSVMDLAIDGGHKEVSAFLHIRNGMNERGLECAICVIENLNGHLRSATRREDPRQASAALAAKADPNHYQSCIPPGKRTPLMSFSAAGNLGIIRDLISSTAMVLALDKFQCSAVHYARAQGHEEVESFLESVKFISERPLRGDEFAQYIAEAVQSGCCGAVWRVQDPWLGERVPDRDAVVRLLSQPVGPFGYSSLHRAVEAARDDIDPAGQVCRALLRAQADPMVKTSKGDTALHLAAGAGNQALYDMMEKELIDRHGFQVAQDVLESETNEFGQAPRECLERTLNSRVRKDQTVQARDSTTLLLAGFLSFKHSWVLVRLNRWRESNAISLTDVLHKRGQMLLKRHFNPKKYKTDDDSDQESPSEEKKGSQSNSPSTSGRTKLGRSTVGRSTRKL